MPADPPEHQHDYDRIGKSDVYPPNGPDYHRHCRRSTCDGIAHIQMEWAPDTGWHWLKCCCCGDYWNPGSTW